LVYSISILTRFFISSSDFGRVIVRTPFLDFAIIEFLFTRAGKENSRLNSPYSLSYR